MRFLSLICFKYSLNGRIGHVRTYVEMQFLANLYSLLSQTSLSDAFQMEIHC